MRLTWKLTIGLLLGVTIALGINLVLRIQREAQVFAADMRQDHALLSSWLAADILEEWRENGPAAAREVLTRRAAALRSPERLTVRAIEPHAVPADELEQLRTRTLVHTEEVGVNGHTLLRTLAPVLDRGAVILAIELDEPMDAVDGYLETTLKRALLAYFFMLICSAGLVGIFGFLVVGRPMQELINKAFRTGRGDLDGPLPATGNDELAVLARALNDMCEQLRAAWAERDAAARSRIAALERLRHVDRLSTMGILAAGIAHELGTPLHVVSGRAQLILDAETSTAGSKKNAKIIVDEAERMTGIVRQLLDFARKRPPLKVRADARGLAQHVVELLSMLARKGGIELRLAPGDDDTTIVGDANQLEQALTNLVVNAIQASRSGHDVVIDVRRVPEATPPTEVGGPPRDEVWLSVKDKAGGVPEAHLDKLFTPFFTTKDVGAGTGLGLAIAWGLVREHDGAIDVDSRDGVGSTFTLRLPAGPTATPP